MHAIGNARYSSLVNDKEQLEQKYLHLSQIIESESTAKWQYSRQCEEFSAEIKKLRQEICLLRRQESRSSHLKLVLAKSAAIVETIMRQQRCRQRQQQQQPPQQQHQTAEPLGGSLGRSAVSEVDEDEERPGRFNEGDEENAASQRLMLVLSDRQTGGPNCLSAPSQPPAASNNNNNNQQQQHRFRLLNRAQSMEQEQVEQEMAVRRTGRRCNRFRLVAANSTSGLLEQTGARLTGRDNAARLMSVESQFNSLLRGSSGSQLPGDGHSPAESPLNGAKRFRSMEVFEQDRRSLCGSSPSPSSLNASGSSSAAAYYTSAKPSSASHRDSGGGTIKRAGSATKIEAATELTREAEEQARLSAELKTVVEALNNGILLSDCLLEVEGSEEIRKIKKVQGFFRGWLCRRRWKQIVQEYIKSPHAESMRKRNNLVFRMVECEEEYVEQLALLISAFLRPIKMAASSQQPALSHDELNSIFLNSETLLFLHQIFLKGLTARMESWPTLVLGDLFNMLLPMLTIYQEFVRNHHFSLQVLAECKQREQFSSILRRLEEKPQLNGRTLETFLTYPMHQVNQIPPLIHLKPPKLDATEKKRSAFMALAWAACFCSR